MDLLYGSYDYWAYSMTVMIVGLLCTSHVEWAYCMAVMMSGPIVYEL